MLTQHTNGIYGTYGIERTFGLNTLLLVCFLNKPEKGKTERRTRDIEINATHTVI